MTSKEALTLLEVRCRYFAQDNMELEEIYEARETIEKDLEVLEILRKWVLVNETYDDLFPYELKLRKAYVSSKSCLILTKEDYEKIKEWLENE